MSCLFLVLVGVWLLPGSKEVRLDEYCRTHALDPFVVAAVKLDEELDRRAKTR